MFPQHDTIEVCWFHNLCAHYWSNAGKIVDSLLAYMFFCLRHTPGLRPRPICTLRSQQMTTARCCKRVQRNLASIKDSAQNEIFCLQVVAIKKITVQADSFCQ